MINSEEKYKELFVRLKEIKKECQDYFKTDQIEVRVTNELLARKIGIGVVTIYRGFRGEFKDPHFATLKLLAAFIKDYDKVQKLGWRKKLFEYFTF